MPRAVLIPPYRAAGAATGALPAIVRFSLVDVPGGQPCIGYTEDAGIIAGASIAVGADGASVALPPNADIRPNTQWLVEIIRAGAPATAHRCTLPAGSDPIDLPTLLQLGYPLSDADYLDRYLLRADWHAALLAAAPDADNRLATLADIEGDPGGSAGHTIRDAAGADLPARAVLRIYGATLADAATAGETRLTVPAAPIQGLSAGRGISIVHTGNGQYEIAIDPSYTIDGGTP